MPHALKGHRPPPRLTHALLVTRMPSGVDSDVLVPKRHSVPYRRLTGARWMTSKQTVGRVLTWLFDGDSTHGGVFLGYGHMILISIKLLCLWFWASILTPRLMIAFALPPFLTDEEQEMLKKRLIDPYIPYIPVADDKTYMPTAAEPAAANLAEHLHHVLTTEERKIFELRRENASVAKWMTAEERKKYEDKLKSMESVSSTRIIRGTPPASSSSPRKTRSTS